VPLWAEVEPVSLAKQGTLTTFAGLAATHFDRFIDGRDLSRFGDAARAVSIDRLPALIAAITPEQVNTDVLFLPPAWPRR